jgi:hypothetical protein
MIVTLAIAMGFAMTTASPASAMVVKHSVDVAQFDIHWTCPGQDPVEHWLWRGRLENRETGELVRDDGSWTNVYVYGASGKHVVRVTTSGAVWRFTVPGEGIVVHQTGRSIAGDQDFASTFGGFADTTALCAFV